MKRKRILITLMLLCLCLLLTAAGSAPESGMTRCLVIGYDRFVKMPSTEPASANNAETMAVLLEDFLPGEKQIRLQVNGPGTVEEFERLVLETFGENREEDTALLYMSTHGVVRPDEPGGMALLLSDGTREEGLTPDRLREILDSVRGKKIVIADACRSGALIGRGTESGVDYFAADEYRVLVSAGAEEDSWFWSAETDEYTGTGYFTGALENALRASDPEQIDPDGNGTVSLHELTERLREIHGASTVYCRPDGSGESLFRLPDDRKAGAGLRAVSIGQTETDGEILTLKIRFRAEEPVRLMYQLVPSRRGRWDFEHAVRMPDRERTGLIRGLVSPGEKERTIRLSRESLGEEGRALMQVISLQGDERRPAAEAGWVIEILLPVQENDESE